MSSEEETARTQAQNDPPPGEGPVLSGTGAAWPPPPGGDIPPAPAWTNGRAFPAVWRDTLAFALGSLLAVTKEFPRMRPGRPWNHRPPPDSDADIDQAIAAKINVSMRALPLLAEADLVVVDPARVASIPPWRSDDEEAVYAATAKLPRSPLFLDFESIAGSPVAWRQDTWPFPFYLRGALCWSRNELLSIIPYGSLGSQHPWGGTDYQAWARWVYLQDHSAEWPELGPGDFQSRASGQVRAWVDGEGGSICAHQGAIAFNLCRAVLSVLICLEAFEVELVPEATSRQVRRRAERKGEAIGLVPRHWPLPLAERDGEDEVGSPASTSSTEEATEQCPIPKTHARLNQCHSMWHEALDAYADPDLFTGRLNAVVQGLRNVTWVLQKELKHAEGFEDWYRVQQDAMKADPRMRWLVSARNRIEKQGDLETKSIAHVRLVASWLEGPVVEMDVDPTSEAHELARTVQVPGLPARVMREGILEVERRWTLEELVEEEILDVLAHCHGVLSDLVLAAHERWGEGETLCEFAVDGVCEGHGLSRHPSGRVPCMIAGRRSRTVRRDLSTGTLVDVEMAPMGGPPVSYEELLERYGPGLPSDYRPRGKGVFGIAEFFHVSGRRFIVIDGYLETVAWILKDGHPLLQVAMRPEDQREKYLAIASLAEEVDRLGANELVFTTEAWEAPAVGPDDERAELRPGERKDRTELMVTYALRRGEKCRVWASRISRTESGEIELGEMTEREEDALFLQPVLKVWEGWASSGTP